MLRLFFDFLDGAEAQRKRQFYLLSLFITLTGFVELAALGSLAMFVTSLASLQEVLESRAVTIITDVFWIETPIKPKQFYLVLGSMTVVLVALKNILTACHTYATARFDGALNIDYGTKMLRGYMNMPYEVVSGRNSSDVLQAITWRVYVGFFASNLMAVFSDAIVSFLLLGTLFLLDPVATICVAAIIAAIGAASYCIFRGRILLIGTKAAELITSVNRGLMRSVQGLKDLLLFNRQSESVGYFRERQQGYALCQARQRVYERATVWTLETVGFGGLVLGSIIMIQTTDSSAGKVMGALSLLAVSAWRILPAVYRCVGALGTIRGFMPYLDKVHTFVRELDRYESGQSMDSSWYGKTFAGFEDGIEFRNVSFRYAGADKDALSELNFRIEAGEIVGVVGYSGAGKSTLADILTGLLKPTNGEILIDQTPLGAGQLEAWRAEIGFVPQSPYLFDGSIAENIAFAINPECVDLERVHECCAMTGVEEFVKRFPSSVHANVGERGKLLSGGQAQRVAIARALYGKPDLLIFDEATSSLDDQNEEIIKKTIDSLRGDRTVVIIAHRLRTIEGCDKVMWIDQGRLKGIGRPKDLLPKYVREKGEVVSEDMQADASHDRGE